MGVYINMEMPQNCGECLFKHLSPTGESIVCDISLSTVSWNERPFDCPLVPVPEHGDLIDRDALADVFRGFIAMYDSCPFSQLSLPDKARRDELQSALAEVINAPTIIPEEEGET